MPALQVALSPLWLLTLQLLAAWLDFQPDVLGDLLSPY